MEIKQAKRAARANASKVEKGRDGSSEADRCNAGAGVRRGGCKDSEEDWRSSHCRFFRSS